MNFFKIQKIDCRLTQALRLCDYVPGICIVSNLTVLFFKTVPLGSRYPAIENTHFWRYIQNKSERECLLLIFVPLVGKIFVALLREKERRSIEDLAKQFIKFNPSWKYLPLPENLIKEIEAIPAAERNSIVELVKPLVNSHDRYGHPLMEGILSAVRWIPATEREHVVDFAKKCVTSDMTGREVADILRMIAAIPRSEREVVVTLAREFVPQGASGFAITHAVSMILHIPERERDIVWPLIKGLVKPGGHIDDASESEYKTITSIVALPHSERETVIALAKEFVTCDTSHFFTYPLVKALIEGAVSSEGRRELCACAQKCMTSDMDAEDRVCIIRSIKEVPAGDREDVLQRAEGLIAAFGIIAPFRFMIIDAIKEVPLGEREAVIGFAKRVFCFGMGAVGAFHIIQEIQEELAGAREAVVEFALRIITPKTEETKRAEIIGIIRGMPPEQREAFVAFVEELTPQELRVAEDIVPIIEAFGRVSIIDRDAVMRDVRARVQPAMNAMERADLIREVEIRLHRPAAPHNPNQNVHADDRDPRTQYAVRKLYEQGLQPSQQEQEAAVQEIIQYFEIWYEQRVPEIRHMCEEQNKSPQELEQALATLSRQKEQARHALDGNKAPRESFGPLLDGIKFSILGYEIEGRELITRLWRFATELPEESEVLNAKRGIVHALADSYDEHQERVCNQGKTQRLCVLVLQGRLEGVNIDKTEEVRPLTEGEVGALFLNKERLERCKKKSLLLAEVEPFCQQNPRIRREELEQIIEDYARLQELEE